MNERIKELAEQAKKYALDAMIKITDKEQALKVYSESYDTKFAELIVRDCMDVVDGYTKPRTFDTHYDAVEQIEHLFGIKHNGVEE
jgi:phage gp46-like protein